MCWLFFGVRPPPHPLVLPQWNVEDPGHSAKSADGRLHRNTHTSLTQRNWSGLTTLSKHRVGTYQGKRAHTQLVREHSATVVSARWATTDWSWPKKWNWCATADLHFKQKKQKQKPSACGKQNVEPFPWVLATKKSRSSPTPFKLSVTCVGFSHLPWHHRWHIASRTQKLKSLLLRTQSLNVLPLKPGVRQHRAMHTMLTARVFLLAYFYPFSPFTCIFSKTCPDFSELLNLL